MKNYIDYMNGIKLEYAVRESILLQTPQKKTQLNKSRAVFYFAGIAACAAVLLLFFFGKPGLGNGSEAPANPIIPTAPPFSTPTPVATAPVSEPPAAEPPVSTTNGPGRDVTFAVNEISVPTGVNAMYYLSKFVPMTYEEITEYFAVTLPVPEILPGFVLQPKPQNYPYGIYVPDEEGRGGYLDVNQFVFSNADGSQSLKISLIKTFLSFQFGFRPDLLKSSELVFSNINGRELAVFHYTDLDGSDCYHVEFVQNGVAYCVVSNNMSQDDYIECILQIVEETDESANPHLIKGTVNVFDRYAGFIGISVADNTRESSFRYFIVRLSADEMSTSCFQKEVIVEYTGEPAEAGVIWQQQIIGFCVVDG